MKKIFEVIVLLLCFCSFLNLLKVFGLGSWGDFNIYYHSATAALHNSNPYLLKGAFIGGYIYPPLCLLLFYPFVWIPLILAGQIWTFVSLACLLIAIWILVKQYNATTNKLLLGVIWILVFNFFPVKFTLGMGQLNNIILLLVVFAMYAIKKKKDGWAGTVFGLALTLKYTPIYILPYLLVRKKWRTIIFLIGTICILFTAGFIIVMPTISIYYFQHVIFSLGFSSSWTDYYNQALSGFLIRDFSGFTNTQITTTRYVLSLLMLAASLYIVSKRKSPAVKNTDLEISIFITLNLLLNTFSEQHHFVLLLIPLLVTYFIIKQNNLSWQYYGILAICYLLAALNMKTPSAYPTILQSHVFYGTLVLWLFDLYLLHKFPNKKKQSISSQERS